MEYLDKDKILDSLTIEDMIKIVKHLGSAEPKRDSQGNLICQTVCHNMPDPNNSWKLYYYHEPKDGHKGKIWHCFSGCSDSFNVVELVIRANRVQGKTITWYRALRWIGSLTGKLSVTSADVIEEETQRITDFEWINRLRNAQKKKRALPQLKGINENILEIFTYNPHESWINDHISMEAMSRFEIGYWGEHDAITIPHRDKEGRLIGIRLRYLDPGDIARIGKYVPAQIEGKFLSHQLGSNLYGLHVVLERVLKTKKIMLVEAEKSCLQAYSYFIEDSFVVALCGSSITATQVRMILALGVQEVIYAPDRDYHEADSYEAQIWYNKQMKKLSPFVPYVKTCLVADSKNRLEYKDSPTDRGKKTLLELLDEKILVTTDEINRVLRNKED